MLIYPLDTYIYLGFREKILTMDSVPVQIISQWQQVLLQTKGRKEIMCVVFYVTMWGTSEMCSSFFFYPEKTRMGVLTVDICPVCRASLHN